MLPIGQWGDENILDGPMRIQSKGVEEERSLIYECIMSNKMVKTTKYSTTVKLYNLALLFSESDFRVLRFANN